MEDPRPVVFSVLSDYIACGDRAFIYEVSGLQAGWLREAPPEFIWFWIEFFVKDPELVRRMKLAYHEVGRAFADLERLHAATYGSSILIPREIVDLVRRRSLNAWFESSREVLDFAQGATAEQAAADLKRLVGVREWLSQFSS